MLAVHVHDQLHHQLQMINRNSHDRHWHVTLHVRNQQRDMHAELIVRINS